ncbi:MAG: iron donor protein CyaY [Deltaproteobacteria bacterium]|nr:iron donor protein CyaY [Deltaproteobacteria bacterium]
MDEARYQKLADSALRAIEDMLVDVDAEVVDLDRSGDVITLTFARGKAIINTQRPTRQIWLAANARAWHFSFDDAREHWLDDKGQGVELLAQVAAIVKESAGIVVTPAPPRR